MMRHCLKKQQHFTDLYELSSGTLNQILTLKPNSPLRTKEKRTFQLNFACDFLPLWS